MRASYDSSLADTANVTMPTRVLIPEPHFHAPPEVPDDDETAFLLSQDKLGQGLLGTRRVNVPFVFVIIKFFIVILLQIILYGKGPYVPSASWFCSVLRRLHVNLAVASRPGKAS